ncbi:MAG TPA: threonine synthase, partial [Hyphomicrobiaceae bacterium]
AEQTLAAYQAPTIVLATAHPAKFPDAVKAITGSQPPLPPRLSTLLTDPERITVLPNDLAAVQRFVVERAGASQGAVA